MATQIYSDPFIAAANNAQAQAYGQALAEQAAGQQVQNPGSPLTSVNPLAGAQSQIMDKLAQRIQANGGAPGAIALKNWWNANPQNQNMGDSPDYVTGTGPTPDQMAGLDPNAPQMAPNDPTTDPSAGALSQAAGGMDPTQLQQMGLDPNTLASLNSQPGLLGMFGGGATPDLLEDM